MYWLGIWLDSQRKFIAYINARLTKVKKVEIRVKRLNDIYKLALRLIKQIQIAAIQSVALYGAKLQQKR